MKSMVSAIRKKDTLTRNETDSRRINSLKIKNYSAIGRVVFYTVSPRGAYMSSCLICVKIFQNFSIPTLLVKNDELVNYDGLK